MRFCFESPSTKFQAFVLSEPSNRSMSKLADVGYKSHSLKHCFAYLFSEPPTEDWRHNDRRLSNREVVPIGPRLKSNNIRVPEPVAEVVE